MLGHPPPAPLPQTLPKVGEGGVQPPKERRVSHGGQRGFSQLRCSPPIPWSDDLVQVWGSRGQLRPRVSTGRSPAPDTRRGPWKVHNQCWRRG